MLWYIKIMDKPNNKGCQHPLSNPNMILESHDKIFEVVKRICRKTKRFFVERVFYLVLMLTCW